MAKQDSEKMANQDCEKMGVTDTNKTLCMGPRASIGFGTNGW